MRKNHHPTSFLGFTLVEIMVAIAVMAVLIVLVTNIINHTAQIITGSGKRMDPDTQARLIFERISLDLANLVNRSDVDVLFKTGASSKNDSFFFFSQASSSGSSTSKSGLSLVGYRMTDQTGDNDNALNTYGLLRFNRGLAWSDNGSLFLNSGVSSSNPIYSDAFWNTAMASSGNFQVLGDQVFRLEVYFQVKQFSNQAVVGSAYSTFPIAKTSNPLVSGSLPSTAQAGDRFYDATIGRAYLCTGTNSSGAVWQPNGLKDVLNIIVCIALLDSSSRAVAANADQRLPSALVDALADAQESTLSSSSVISAWNSTIQSPSFPQSVGIPKIAAGRIRVYQRHFPIVQNSFK